MTTINHLLRRDQLVASDHAEKITAITVEAWSEVTPGEPLRITIDHALLPRLSWQAGDRLTVVPIALDRHTREGGLIVRKADPGEPSFSLSEFTSSPEEFPAYLLPLRSPDGPQFEWVFPPEWVEAFFPPAYAGFADCFLPTDRSWKLSDLRNQRDQLALIVDCSFLYLFLQRTSPEPTKLDVHLIPGLLHLMGWTQQTPLILESASDFSPDVTSDTLTIRPAVPWETPTLARSGDKFVADVNPSWLHRFLPSHYDASVPEELPSQEEWMANADDREKHPDTMTVGLRDIEIGPNSFSFTTTLPAAPSDHFGP